MPALLRPPPAVRAVGPRGAGRTRARVPWLGGAVVLLTLLGGALRVHLAGTEFWFDEIWSWEFARELRSPWEALLLAHDNNHVLNTIWMAWLGPDRPVLAYRALSVAGGTALVPLLALAARPAGRAAAAIAALLAAVSFPLAVYTSEARGYGLAVLLGTASFVALARYRREPSLPRLWLFWALCVTGLLAHLTFVYVWLALLAADVVTEVGRGRGARATAAALLPVHTVPLGFAGLVYLVLVRRMVYGGGPGSDAAGVVAQTLSLAVGVEPGGSWAAAACLLLAGWSLCRGWAAERGRRLFFACVLLLTPGCVLLATRPAYLAPRYFVVCLPFAYLLLADTLAALARRRGAWRVGSLALLGAVVAGHGTRVVEFRRLGRGAATATLARLTAETGAAPVALATNNEFRTRFLLSFHAPRTPGGGRVHLVSRRRWGVEPPRWYLRYPDGTPLDGRARLRLAGGWEYARVQAYPASPISGLAWTLYRRSDAPARPEPGSGARPVLGATR